MEEVIDKVSQGRKNRQNGAAFELRVRKDLEKRGYIVSKWLNNVDLDLNIITPAKPSRFRLMGTGFPDFICIDSLHNHILVEVKINGYLDKKEREKVLFYKSKGFKVYLAKKKIEKHRIEIVYELL